jgi:regulator of nucleoside diphosphate kinase
MQKQIVITNPDILRLEQLVHTGSALSDDRLQALEQELNRAEVVAPEDIAKTVVTMNSRMRIQDLDRDVEFVCTVVFPAEANAEQNRVSVLAPLGTALLGCRVGQIVRFSAPGGVRRVKIIAIEYQPEAAARKRLAASSGRRKQSSS